MTTAYIAAPLFNDAEKAFNLTVDSRLHEAGFRTYLPQRDGGDGAAMVARGAEPGTVRAQLFTADVTALRTCDLLIMVLDGRVPDEGACVELGIAYAQNTPCVGLQTDARRFSGTNNNLMITGILSTIATTLDELVAHVSQYLVLSESAGDR
ncbi:nucleoside 2-deoxyribosyltransferase [Saccharopolyspora lacisalsi]|uniref:Nucleoside 2-deoxyribosyltransferase n=1 Tax=Halosaccharopolyspora lacisalsi TaxID=1000566 RepID=A0A839DS59_9PSEU|nr:nucleoside 2-deoxyribosyltransferase [Halosaccharopolyspora lacisalsi]MBA8823790.1 nucleoside 2-deoxyribosyltransferase [Halosaccharopolyspora lacisalsi]